MKKINNLSFAPDNESGSSRKRVGDEPVSPRKFLSLLFCLLFVGIGQMWSADVEVYTLSGTTTATGNAYATASDVTQSEKAWKVTANTEQNPWRVGGKASAKGQTDTFYRDIYCTSALTSDNVNKVILSHGTTDLTGDHGVDSVELFVSTAQNRGGTVTSKILRTFKTSDTIIINRPAGADWSNKYFTIRYKIHVKGTSNKHFQFIYAKFYKAGCTALGTINGSVTLSQLATPNPTKLKATWSMNATTGIASYDLEVYNSSNVKVKTINNYTSGDEITGLDPCTTYYVKLYTVSSGSPYCDGGLIGTSSTCTTNGYTLTVTKSNVSLASGSEPSNICSNVSATYSAGVGYNLPTSITVTNAGAENTGWTWNSSTGALTINKANVTGNVTVTITGVAEGCSGKYTFAYGATANADGKNIDGATKLCFEQVSTTDEFQVTGFTIPTTTQYYWVGYNGSFYDGSLGTNGAKSSRNQFKYLPVANLQGSSCGGEGDSYKHAAAGAYGLLRIYRNYSDDNLYVGFSPAGYQMRIGSGDSWTNVQLTQDGSTWTSDLVTLDAATVAKKYYINVWTGSSYSSSDAGVAINNWTDGNSTISSMVFKTGADTWNTTSGLSAGMRGKFRTWTDNCSNNGYCHFVPYYQLQYNPASTSGTGTGSMSPLPASPLSCEESAANRTVTVATSSFTAPQYKQFDHWNTAADNSGSNVSTGSYTLTSDVTLYAQWAYIPVTALTLNHNSLKKFVGESTVTLSVTGVTPAAANPAVNWSSSDATVASVTDGGVVSFLKAGTATITATSTISGGVTATCSVEVRSISSPTMQDETGAAISTGVNKPSVTWTLGTRTLTANEETSNYKFKRWVVTNATPASTTNLSTTLGDPTGNVTVVAEFYKPKTVTKGTGTGTGTFTISASEVKYNSSVTVTCAPDASHKNPWTITITPADGATVASSTGSSGSITVSNITKNITIDLEYTDRGCTEHYGTNVVSGSSSSDATYGPIYASYKYSTRQILYTRTDLNVTAGNKGTIKSISFDYNGAAAMDARNITIYMANTTLTALAASAGNFVPYSEFTQVYSGSFSCSSAGWYEIELDEPFVYYGNKNLVVLIDDNTGSYQTTKYFNYHTANTTTGAQIHTYNDYTNEDPSKTTWTSYRAVNYRPNTKFCLQESAMSQYAVTWHVGESTSTTSNVYEGTTFSSLSGSQPAHADNALAACGSTKFIGWVSADGEWNEDGKTVDWYNSYKIADNYQITGNTDFYAMYAEASGGGSTTKSYGWEASESDASSWTISGPSQSSNQHNTGSYSGYINTNNTYVTFNEKVNVTEFSFYFTRTSDNNNYNVYIETSANGSDWSAAATFAMNSFATSVNWKKCSKTWDGETAYYVRFHCSNTTAVRYVDDVSITYGSTSYSNYRTGCTVSCSRPTPATPASITKTGATISWTDPATSGTLDHYEYKVWEDGDDEPVSGTTNGTNLSKALTGLYSGVTYHWKVRRVCSGEDASIWVAGLDFTTTDATLTFSVPTGATAVDPSTTATNLPEADAPTDCGDCWAFVGWTTAAYAESSSAPATLFPAGIKARVSGDATLYAVYKKTKYRIVGDLAGISADEYYVLTFDAIGPSSAMKNTVTTYYTTEEDVVIKEDNTGAYLENPSADATWIFTGTTSAGRFQNVGNSKYMDLSDSYAAPLANSTSDYVNITVENAGAKRFDIESNTTNGNYLQLFNNGWGVDDDDHSGYFSCRIFKRAEAAYTTSPDCPKYTVTWDINNGATTSTTDVTKCEGYLSALPSAPADNTLSSCQTNGKFMGWSADKVMPAQDIAPADIFSEVEDAPEITENVTFYAVFANGVAGAETPVNTTYTFNSKSWGDATNSWSSDDAGDGLTDGRGIQIASDGAFSGAANGSAAATTKNNYTSVTKVIVTYSTNKSAGAGTIAIKVNNVAYTGNASVTSTGGTSDRTIEYTPTTAQTGKVNISVSCTTNSIFIKSVQIYYTGAGTVYEQYRTACCNDPGFSFTDENDAPVTEYTIVREDLASASAAVEIGCNYTSANTEGAITWYSTRRAALGFPATGAYTWTTPSSQPAGLNIDIANKKISASATGVWTITINQAEGGTTYCPVDAVVTVRVKTVDKFVDAVNGNFGGDAQRREDTGDGITLPTEAEFSIDDGCSTERRLLGWVKESDLSSYTSGYIDSWKTDDPATNKVIAPGTKVSATGITWYAVWGVEKY